MATDPTLVAPDAATTSGTPLATGGLGEAHIHDFAKSIAAEYPIYQADDILLKTIMRSNPGLILWKDGKIIQKWHHKHLPSEDELKSMIK